MTVTELIKDINNALKHYRTLVLHTGGKVITVEGEIPLVHKSYGEFDRYSVLIRFPTTYPFCFPRVVETSKKIPRIMDRHINSDKTLCFGVFQDEYQCAQSGITFKYFLDRILVPHLSRETYRSKEGKYPDGERGHGIEGIWDYYFEHLKISEKSDVLSELQSIVKLLNVPSINENCYCGSEIKFKHCHLKAYNQIVLIGDEKVKSILKMLTENFER